MFALVLVVSILGAVFHAPDGVTNTANAIIAPSPISVAAAGVTELCKHTSCQNADGIEYPQLNRDVYN